MGVQFPQGAPVVTCSELRIWSDFEQIIVAGGSALNASFVEENLVDEIYLDIEPIILGKVIPLFRDKDFEHKLKLIGQKNNR